MVYELFLIETGEVTDMLNGKLVGIFTSPKAGELMVSNNEIRAIPGKGLQGDRYFSSLGPSTKKPDPGREVTLIEVETISALERDLDIVLNLGDSRRNLVTKGVALNHLVGQDFKIGEVSLRGVRLCEPCSHLAKLTKKEVLPALVHRGGLRAQILNEGFIHVGDPIVISDNPSRV